MSYLAWFLNDTYLIGNTHKLYTYHTIISNLYCDVQVYWKCDKHILCCAFFVKFIKASACICSILLQFAAHQLHQDAKNWEEKDNDMVSAAKRMARLMMQMAKYARSATCHVISHMVIAYLHTLTVLLNFLFSHT